MVGLFFSWLVDGSVVPMVVFVLVFLYLRMIRAYLLKNRSLLVCGSVGWLVGLLVGCLVGSLVGWFVGWLVGVLVGWLFARV